MKIIKINSCVKCPFCEEDGWNRECYCNHEDKKGDRSLDFKEDFPEWCPLEDI